MVVFSVPCAASPAVGKPTDDVLSSSIPDAFPGTHATPPSCVNGSTASPYSAANDLPTTNAGKLVCVLV